MSDSRMRLPFLLVLLVLALMTGWTRPASAIELFDSKLEIHGYGDTNFLLANHNRFLGADSKGDFNAELALLFAARVTDNTTIWTQIFGNEDKIRLDWAFVGFTPIENFELRGGQIKTPIGIYNEIRDIKYLQLSTIAPYIYQEAADISDEAFRGVSAIYDLDLPVGGLNLNAYGGQSVAFGNDPATHNQMFGGRIIYRTPLEGLRIMASGFTAKAGEGAASGRADLILGSVDYVNFGADVKAEYAYMKVINEKKQSYYVQAGYTFFDKLTPFVRYDYITTDRDNDSDPSFYQKDLSFGAGYKINNYVALKIEDHFIKGYALPVAGGEVLPNEGHKNWNLFAVGLDFMF